MYWSLEKKGVYSIKTGYWSSYINKLKEESREEAGSSRDMTPFWNKLWKLQIPPKVKIFAWKLAHDIVASEANLTPTISRLIPGAYCAVSIGPIVLSLLLSGNQGHLEKHGLVELFKHF